MIQGYLDPIRTQRVEKTITFTGASALGEVDVAVPLFTVTGEVLIERIMPLCTVNLAGATATLALGVTGSTALFIAATTATDIDANKFWVDTAPDANGIALPAALKDIMITDDIIGTPATETITGGAIRIVIFWRPISADGMVVPA